MVVPQVKLLAQPILDELGLELVEIQYRREQIGWVLRLIIYKKGGVGLEDCSQLSRQLGYVLEVEDIIDQHFHLEVSSPGLDRPLTKIRDFERNIGQKVTVTFRGFSDVDDVCIGRIDSVDDQAVILYTQGGKREIQLNDIIKARLVIEF
ncbi:MAG: ribosome maturation factor RimP [Thermodesulfobacteriota bacterium]|nr:ribosome maturation factor RimP [Thermodesulfobacteriota bacterium]